MQIEPLWQDFHERLRYFILSITNDSDLSEDLTQDVFIKIHSNLHRVRKQESLEKWIYRIARNVINDHFRKHRPESAMEDKAHQIPTESAPVSGEQRLADSVRGMILGLPPKYRDVLWATEIEGISQVKLAQMLNMSHSGVKSRVQRARKMLHDTLMKCCHFEFDRRGTVIDYHPIECCCCDKSAAADFS